ncbi:MAG: hypothetical protein K6F53_11990 [Lachnospiraceae bacterium]|nr:hypothetical protein [Lachnospiraceae bacterium]
MKDKNDASGDMKREREKEKKPGKFREWIALGDTERVIPWDRLDNTANLFPAIAGESMTNVYRISVTLKEEIDPALLQEALDIVLPKIGSFNVRLRKGMFWYYFEENGKPAPKVEKEITFPCRYIRQNRNRSYLFRVSYYEKRINLEVFHVLTDGMGGINFIRELTYQYLRLTHPELRTEGDSLTKDTSLNVEDSFVRNYKKSMPRGFERKKAYLIKGEKLPEGEFGLMHVYFPRKEMKAAATNYGVSVNTYLTACFSYAIYTASMKMRAYDKPIRIAIPVNLRPYYNSNTTRNFFIMVSAEYLSDGEVHEFPEVVSAIDQSLKSQIGKEHLEDLFSYSVSNQENLWLRLFPLPVKSFAMRIVYNQSALANTATMTNIGEIPVDETYKPFIERFHANIAMSKGQYLKGTICAYEGAYVFTFSTILADTSIERAFLSRLRKDGVPVSVETNGVFERK